ncbi:hypothetical protein, conserved [Trypanosoma brucei gambiense DAL972]|uniref:J domain-containing protein n=2 Tax=Trypanosoma brucei TaxID=5691 RepID=D0A9S5_TRYB9|nr:hypothetical protein, conserved [Trypanosoma brucei gambiense DAL972]RHW67957.1 DnaJ domain containing protein [Trypanosoma brucei equiperdum]CBH18426.1 hypothetical protein, conserved [Trypanosoma brucei gambiense DAL972]|eukprot:XP_011780690.1 hypothetical protein, conserved [Trypanosoma brucei gambiense DAL972]
MWRFRAVSAIAPRGCFRCVFQSKAFAAATKTLPCTPEGKNPYDVLEVTVTNSTTLNDISKQFRELVVRNHPDQPCGSHEKMSELNAAYKIVKEHHEGVLRRLKEYEADTKGNGAFQQHRRSRAQDDRDLGRTGGVFRRNARAAEQASASKKARSLQEITSSWSRYREDTEHAVTSMCNRYELAVEKGCFFRKTSMLNEITVRERWLRKSYIKAVWEEVHELRGELLRRGARSSQQSQLAEEMVSFASATQRKLNEDFQRLTQLSVQSQTRLFLQRILVALVTVVVFIKLWQSLLSGMFRNSLTVRFRQGILSH